MSVVSHNSFANNNFLAFPKCEFWWKLALKSNSPPFDLHFSYSYHNFSLIEGNTWGLVQV